MVAWWKVSLLFSVMTEVGGIDADRSSEAKEGAIRAGWRSQFCVILRSKLKPNALNKAVAHESMQLHEPQLDRLICRRSTPGEQEIYAIVAHVVSLPKRDDG